MGPSLYVGLRGVAESQEVPRILCKQESRVSRTAVRCFPGSLVHSKRHSIIRFPLLAYADGPGEILRWFGSEDGTKTMLGIVETEVAAFGYFASHPCGYEIGFLVSHIDLLMLVVKFE